MGSPTCFAIGCRALILDTEIFCRRHLLIVESDLRRVLERTYSPGKRRQSARFQAALSWAQGEILYFQLHGHVVPQASSFEFDDEGGVDDAKV